MSDVLQSAIQFARDEKPTEFKDAIYSALQKKVEDTMFMQKMQVANKIFNNGEESQQSETELSPEEENVDEDL